MKEKGGPGISAREKKARKSGLPILKRGGPSDGGEQREDGDASKRD